MPIPKRPPRLWLRPERRSSDGRILARATWLVLDLGRQIATNCRAHDTEGADQFLRDYIDKNYGGKVPVRRRTVPVVKKPRTREIVYFVSCAEDANYPIKIGRSTEGEIKRRLSHMQMSVPHTLTVLATIPGGKDRERDMHIAFCTSRIRGEWFARDPDLMAFLSAIMVTDRQCLT